MSLLHKYVLYASLGFLGISLIIPGLIEIFKVQAGSPDLVPETIAAKNQLRALNGVMTAMGFMALWACIDLENAKVLTQALGGMLLLVFAARLYSFIIDGLPAFMTWVYAFIELLLAVIFLAWPPGK